MNKKTVESLFAILFLVVIFYLSQANAVRSSSTIQQSNTTMGAPPPPPPPEESLSMRNVSVLSITPKVAQGTFAILPPKVVEEIPYYFSFGISSNKCIKNGSIALDFCEMKNDSCQEIPNLHRSYNFSINSTYCYLYMDIGSINSYGIYPDVSYTNLTPVGFSEAGDYEITYNISFC